MSLVLIHSERFAEHQTPPGHPERAERAQVMDVIAARWRQRGGDVMAPRAATLAELARVHDGGYLQRLAATSGRAVALDRDTFTSPDTYDIVLLAAGAAMLAVEQVWAGPHQAAIALVRPPGHHAERGRAMGFCLCNNVAAAAAHARTLGAERVAIVDYDVHHGNGTEHIFESDSQVLYVSAHQFPFYPGTGACGDIGRGDGAGFTVNLPLEAGATADDYRVVFTEVVVPVLQQFRPDLLLVSAGFDAHERDPLGGMRLTTAAFRAMTGELRVVAEACCGGRIVAVTEGGYDLRMLGESLETLIDAFEAPRADVGWPSGPDTAARRGHAAADQAKGVLRPFWRL